MALAVTESADTEDVTLLPTQVAKLGCPCNTKYVWINDSQISTSTCETASDECDRFEPASDVCDGGTCTVVTFRDTLATNSTQIWCDKYGDETSVTVASYFVVGKPSSIGCMRSSFHLIAHPACAEATLSVDMRHALSFRFPALAESFHSRDQRERSVAKMGGTLHVERCRQYFSLHRPNVLPI